MFSNKKKVHITIYIKHPASPSPTTAVMYNTNSAKSKQKPLDPPYLLIQTIYSCKETDTNYATAGRALEYMPHSEIKLRKNI